MSTILLYGKYNFKKTAEFFLFLFWLDLQSQKIEIEILSFMLTLMQINIVLFEL